jgi:hypothetical protein
LKNNQLFISGTARGGTNLAIMMLSVHPDVSLSQDPFLALYKSFFNAVLSTNGLKEKDLQSPLYEYYYFREKIEKMHLLQKSDLNMPFNNSKLEELKTVIADRMKLSSPLLIPHLNQLKGNNYKTLFDYALAIVRKGRNEKNLKWVGFNDNWCIEFFAPLARTYKNAKFISIVRDVRGAIASHIKLVDAIHTNPLYQYKKDVSMLALTMSFARCWRKHVAFSYNYQMSRLLKDRILIIKYEDLVSNPQIETEKISDFLDIDYFEDMIDTNNFIAPDGGKWLPNSNQGHAPQKGIFTSSIDKWKDTLPNDLLDLIELVVGPDLEMCGYEALKSFNSEMVSNAYQRHKYEHENWVGGGWGWRTDNYNPELDISFELLRRNTIENNKNDKELLELMLLFPDLINNYN